ncbi:MAG: S8 family serine peptidase [Myxococcaceae bacterium]|nr:S8 family serine peptidase [Myxococcaceae bacterium]
MKRWVLLGLVGWVACKGEEPEPEPVPSGTQDCTSPTQQWEPIERSITLELESDEASLQERDGREPVLVRYRRTLSAQRARADEDVVTRAGGQVTTRWPWLGAVAARVTPEQRAALARDPDVLSIEPDRVVRAFGRQALVTTGSVGEYTPGLKMVQAPLVWDSNPEDGILDANAPNGTGIKVCVIDSGWDNRHPELKAAYVEGKDFIDDDDDPLDFDTATSKWGGGHGTHTAATIVAQLASAGNVNPGEEPAGVVGVAPGVELYVARVLNTRGSGNTSDIVSALQWCESKEVHIVSMSLGAPEKSSTEEAAIASAIAAGILPIAATGNSGTGDPATEPGVAFPAAYPGVLAVGAVDADKVRATFSQVGPEVGLMAPGVQVLSAMIQGAEAYSLVEVDGRPIESRSLSFAPIGEYIGKVIACGLGDSRDACGAEATCDGFVAYVDRGGLDGQGNGLTFAKKVTYVRRAGARAVIIGNNDPNDGQGSFTLGEAADNWLPTASVSFADGQAIKGLKGKDGKVRLVGVDYARLSGTSMATPHVSGVAALVWSARPSLTAAEVKEILLQTAEDHGEPGPDNIYGRGLVQAKAALDELRQRYP